MNREEALRTLGGVADEYWSVFYDKQGIYYQDLEEYIWAGLFGFCCCGAPGIELKKIKETLLCASKHLCLPEELQIYGYLIHYWEYAEHGSSIYSAWLTSKGEALLVLLDEWDKI